MDFWSRLIGGTGSSPARAKPVNTNSQVERLAACKRLCNALQQIWRASTPLSSERAASQVTNCVNLLNTLLDDESKRAAPYSCLLYIASSQIYIIVSKLALSLEDSQVTVASVRFFHILINGEAEGVLDSKLFARSLVELVRKTTAQPRTSHDNTQAGLSEQDEGRLIELLFSVTTKIRLDPGILPAWFYPERDQPEGQNVTSPEVAFVGATRKNAFPLFYLLIQYVYDDGQMGDFARTGLLFLTEIASKSKGLEKWMIESDLATLMASGLGALYSRLTRRLPDLLGDERLPTILALSDFVQPSDPVASAPSEYQHDLDAFLSYLKFWQDTLDHCASADVTETLLDHFQVLFLQQLLYPSLLESSDVDGGSTASVITYLFRILESLDHPALIRRTLQYLLGHNRDHLQENIVSHRRSRMSLSRRKSLDHLTALAEAQENLSPALFNLRDLIVMSLKSKQSQTTTATLKLLSVILQRHHGHVRTSLLTLSSIHEDAPLWRMSTLNSQMSKLFRFAANIAKDVDLNESYENVANDISLMLGNHSCSLQLAEDDSGASEHYSIAHSCPLKRQMSELLCTFFANPITTNLALTESIISLACCRLISLSGWFIPMLQASDLTEEQPSSICSIIESLVQQIGPCRSSFEDWDSLLAMQKRKLLDEKDEKDEEFEDYRLPSSSSDRVAVEIVARGRRGRSLRSEIFGSMDGSLSPSLTPKTSTIPDPIAASPFSFDVDHPSGKASSWSASPGSDILHRRILLPQFTPEAVETPRQQHSHISLGDTATDTADQMHDGTVSLGHILINAVILQEFVLEVAALVQVRAGLFEEVDFE